MIERIRRVLALYAMFLAFWALATVIVILIKAMLNGGHLLIHVNHMSEGYFEIAMFTQAAVIFPALIRQFMLHRSEL